MKIAEPSWAPSFFIARQPILTAGQKLFAYELLFRSGVQAAFDPSFSGEQATSKVISNSFFMLGLDKVTHGKKAFINFTEEMLLNKYPLLCDRKLTVVEVLEDVKVGPEIVKSCRHLADKGYTLALDDFAYSPAWAPLLTMAKIVKFDIMLTDRQNLIRQVEQVRPFGVKLLAEKVESQEEFEFFKDLGFHYFQGFFFSKPAIISGRDIPSAKLNVLRLLGIMNDLELDFDFSRLSGVVGNDLSLSYRLLKFVNSSWLGLPNKIESVNSAVAMLGEESLRKWLSLIALSMMADDKPSELMRMAIFRSAFCEKLAELAPPLRGRAGALATIGMFSLLEAILDKPMAEILAELSLSDEVNDALLGKKGGALTLPLRMLQAYEYGEWSQVDAIAGELKVEREQLPALFSHAVNAVALLEDTL